MTEFLFRLLLHGAAERLQSAPRLQLLARLGFGLICTGFCAIGAYQLANRPALLPSAAVRLGSIALLISIGLAALFNLALFRRWRWTLWLVPLSLGGLLLAGFLS